MTRSVATLIVGLLVLGSASNAWAGSTEELEQKLKALEDQVNALKKQISKAAPPAAPVTSPPVAEPSTPYRPFGLSEFKLGGYGSTRFETTDLDKVNNTFTFRRFVLTGDAAVGERLRGLFELELERLTNLEVEREAPSEGGFRGFSQSIEGSDQSEVSLEQAWLQFQLTDWANFRAGMLLVPLGRFNINHDDNRWELPRRSLVDRGVSVLPVKAAWPEVGMGFTGDIEAGDAGKFSYQAYVMNGVALDSSIETIARGSGELEAEVEIRPRRGTANLDIKRDKAGAFRLAWSPAIGHEIGASVYYGRYTPDFLPSEAIWAVGLDGKFTLGPFEIEGEYIRTHFNRIRNVARGFAQAVAEKQIAAGTAPLDVAVEFELAGLASTKHGYWLDLRYRFWPEFLSKSILGWKLDNPQLILTARGEQVWFEGLVGDIDFTGGTLTRITDEDRWINRVTLGLAYRPVPQVVFQTAFERTWTNSGKSLSAVTNFIPARRSEDTANVFLFGVAFGF
jgi:hypothetical protein